MSRSYKKNKVFKDRNPGSKQINHKKFRRKSKIKLTDLDNIEKSIDELPHKMEETMNSYDISDYKWDCTSDEDCRCLKKYKFKKCIKK